MDGNDKKNINLLPNLTSEETAKQLESKLSEIKRGGAEQTVEKQAAGLGLPYINLKGFPVSPVAIALISQEQAEALNVVCFFYSGSEIRLGSTNPENPQLTKLAAEMAKEHHAHMEIYLISQDSLTAALKLYEKIPKIKKFAGGVEISEADLNKYQNQIGSFEELQKLVTEVSMTDLVTIVLASSLKTGASDVHIEAEEKDVKIRFRIDGVLNTVATLPTKSWPKVISRVKLLSNLKLNITAKPQDGRFTIFLAKDKVDVRRKRRNEAIKVLSGKFKL